MYVVFSQVTYLISVPSVTRSSSTSTASSSTWRLTPQRDLNAVSVEPNLYIRNRTTSTKEPCVWAIESVLQPGNYRLPYQTLVIMKSHRNCSCVNIVHRSTTFNGRWKYISNKSIQLILVI